MPAPKEVPAAALAPKSPEQARRLAVPAAKPGPEAQHRIRDVPAAATAPNEPAISRRWTMLAAVSGPEA